MSKLFHLIEDGVVILRTKRGVYRQAKVYHRGADVYAGCGGSGFVRLQVHSGTTCPDILWSDLSAPGVTIPRIGNPKFSEVESFEETTRKAA